MINKNKTYFGAFDVITKTFTLMCNPVNPFVLAASRPNRKPPTPANNSLRVITTNEGADNISSATYDG